LNAFPVLPLPWPLRPCTVWHAPGSGHVILGLALNNLGYVLKAQGQRERALECYEEALAIRTRCVAVLWGRLCAPGHGRHMTWMGVECSVRASTTPLSLFVLQGRAFIPVPTPPPPPTCLCWRVWVYVLRVYPHQSSRTRAHGHRRDHVQPRRASHCHGANGARGGCPGGTACCSGYCPGRGTPRVHHHVTGYATRELDGVLHYCEKPRAGDEGYSRRWKQGETRGGGGSQSRSPRQGRTHADTPEAHTQSGEEQLRHGDLLHNREGAPVRGFLVFLALFGLLPGS
jgi:hypothetical protein